MNDKVNFLELPWEDVQKIMRNIGGEVRQLADRGDKLAQAVYNRYCECAYQKLPLDHPTVRGFRQALHDYMYRDLTISDRTELGGKFGHLVEGEQGPRPIQIVVPGSTRRQ